VASVEELVRSLTKAIRAHQLYLPNNPIYKGAIDALRAGFAPMWAQVDELVFGVSETELLWYGRPVLVETGKGADSLPWLLFKDGLRELRLSKGFEQEELGRFLDILQRVRKAATDQDDILTMLWEGDFQLLQYRYVDLAMEAAESLDDTPAAARPDRVDITAVMAMPEEEVQASRRGVVDMSDFDATLYFLDEREIQYLRDAVRLEYQLDQRQNVLSVLLDIFEQQSADEIRAELCDILEMMLVHLLAGSHFRNVAYLLRETAVSAQRAADLTEEHRRRIAGLPERLSAASALSQMLEALDGAPELPPQDELSELFDQLRPAALETALAWLGRVQNARLRTLLEQSVGRLAGANTAELVRLIASAERVVSLEAVRRSGALKTPAAVAPLGRLLAEGDVEQRQAAVAALAEIGSPGALQALERGLGDADRDVRVGTARALAGRGYRAALPRIEAIVKSKQIREADLTEKMAFFEMYGALCGESGVPHLDALLNGKGFLGRREDPEVRACAALALGRIGTPKAIESLRGAGAEKDVVVRNAVNRAMRGGAG
jgi:hypothetical protein